MSRQYFTLIAGLPDILIDEAKMALTASSFREELAGHLHPDDYQLIELFSLPIDQENIINILQRNDKPFFQGGIYTEEVLLDAIKEYQNLPHYMLTFIKNFQEEYRQFPQLSLPDEFMVMYYDYLKANSNPFIRAWAEFDQNLRNLLIGLNSRKFGFKAENYLLTDSLVTDEILKSNAPDFNLSREYPVVDELLRIFENANLLEREKGIDLLRWDFLDESTFFYYFTIERVIAYWIKLNIVERWLKLDNEKGEKLFSKLLGELENSFTFSEEFAINGGRKNAN